MNLEIGKLYVFVRISDSALQKVTIEFIEQNGFRKVIKLYTSNHLLEFSDFTSRLVGTLFFGIEFMIIDRVIDNSDRIFYRILQN